MRKFSTDRDLSEFFAWLALIIAGLLLIIQRILGWTDISLGIFGTILAFIRDLSFVLGLGLAGYRYTQGRSKVVGILFWIALIAYVVFAILGLF